MKEQEGKGKPHREKQEGGLSFREHCICRLPLSILEFESNLYPLEPQWGGNSGIAEDQHTQAEEWCFSLLFKNSASLPFAKAEAVLFLRLEFIKASNMINNLYTWIVIQKKIRNQS